MEPNESAFDLDRYLRVCGATKPERFDWTTTKPQPRLSDDALFTIAYMMDIESHTIVYLRDLLSTRVVRDHEVTAFLSCWAYEEFFHSLLLRRFLATQGVSVEDKRFADLRSRASRRSLDPSRHRNPVAHDASFSRRAYDVRCDQRNLDADRLPGIDQPHRVRARPLCKPSSTPDHYSGENHQGRTAALCFLFQSSPLPASRARRAAPDRIPGAKLLGSGRGNGRGDPAMRRLCAYLFPGERGVEHLAAVDRCSRAPPRSGVV